ncbi:recombinase family protein [Streptomyces sp. S07_1.15]|uniref:recombinase family protein n=1 Tax=Streptomyces sp. S07_1.15 TaxID=2873925 RepID=UPI001D14452B|nr:recombinase family protein [Streptomyces sp. S07_1.15]MCC3654721.1 recombinase family protein [Streptomyces sp. S07_1.15]
MNTKTLPRRTLVFLYARISEDPRDRRRGVNRQMSDLRTFSEENGWEVGGEYIENDVSAHSGEGRPEYDRLMADALEAATEPGVRVIVAGYHPSRVWRRRVERAQAIEDLRHAGCWVAFESGGLFNMAKASDRSQLANLGESDTAESEVKSERVARAALERAQEGRANGAVAYGWRRQYEYDARGQVSGFQDVEDPVQAGIVREIVIRLLAGGSLIGITADLNERRVPSPGAGMQLKRRAVGQNEDGSLWNKTSVKKLALRPANVGLRVHQGVEYKAAWPALITDEQYAQLRNLFAERTVVRELPGARKHLLTWGEVATCGPCGSVLRVAPKGNAKRGRKQPTYVCDVNGCVGRNEEALDRHVGRVVVGLLSRPEAAEVFRGDDSAALAALERAEGLKARQEAAADDYADGIITREQLRRITAKLAAQITDAQNEARRLRPAFDLDAFDGLVGPRSEEAWEALQVPQQRRVLDGLGLRLRVHPVARRGPGFDQSTIELQWVRTGD